MASQNPQEITLLPALWDSGDVPIRVPEDCTWGIPQEMMPDVRRLLVEGKVPAFHELRFSLEDFQHLISFLYRNRREDVSLKDAIAEEIAALDAGSSQASRNSSSGSIPPFNGIWVRITGTGRRLLPDKQRWIAEAVGDQLAANGYGLLHDAFPGVDDIVASRFSSALGEQRQLVTERVKMFPSPMYDENGSHPSTSVEDLNVFDKWGEATNEVASAVIIIGGEGGTLGIYRSAIDAGVPVIPVRDSGGDADTYFRQMIEGREAVAYRDLLIRQRREIGDREDAVIVAQQVSEILRDILGSLPSMTKDQFTKAAQQEEGRREVVFVDDIQRGRWGRSATSNGYILMVNFGRSIGGEVIVALTIQRLEGFPSVRGWAAFYYQTGRSQQQLKVSAFLDSGARTEFIIGHACTVGAYLQDATVLELDLNIMPGAPKSFYYTAPPDSFRELVSGRFRKNKVKVKNDIQKNRWGGKSRNNGKLLNARVTRADDDAGNDVTLEVLAESQRQPLTGWVAFFLPFEREIAYYEVKESSKGGIATITVDAGEAFTAGAMTQDGTLLELDLQEIKGFPSEFYYEKRKPKIAQSNRKGGARSKKK